MKNPMKSGRRALAMVAMLLALFDYAALASVEKRSLTLADGSVVDYRLVLPDDYDPGQSYPAILAFSGDSQNARNADWMVRTLMRKTAEDRGYLVFVPIAPDDEHVFYGKGIRFFPEFLDRLIAEYPIKDDWFHLVGVSNGGISAFTVAALNPLYFPSILVMPGYVGIEEDNWYLVHQARCIVFIAGQRDHGWADLARRDVKRMQELGMNPHLEIVKNQNHIPSAYIKHKAYKLFDLIEQGAGCPQPQSSEVQSK